MTKERRSLRTLYRCWSRRDYAERFLDGEVWFRNLSCYRDIVDGNVRGDGNEGAAVMWVPGGIRGYHLGQPTVFPYDQLRSTAYIDEILVSCLTDRLTELHISKFGSAVVQISYPKEFIRRVGDGLPSGARFHGLPENERLLHRVKYVKPTDALITRWAIPGQIGITKLADYEWQSEVRLMFCTTDAFDLEGVGLQLEMRDGSRPPCPIAPSGPLQGPRRSPASAPPQAIPAGNLRDIARILSADEAQEVARRSRSWLGRRRPRV